MPCSCFPPLSAPAANSPNKPKPAVYIFFYLCTCSCVLSPKPQRRQQRRSSLGKTSLVQQHTHKKRRRSMFPKVLLQWCAAISSCAAEIGKRLPHFVCLLCQQKLPVLWDDGTLQHWATPPGPRPRWLSGLLLWCRASVTIQWCWAVGSLSASAETQHRGFFFFCRRRAPMQLHPLSKASLCLCRAHGCSPCFSHPISSLSSAAIGHMSHTLASGNTHTHTHTCLLDIRMCSQVQ